MRKLLLTLVLSFLVYAAPLRADSLTPAMDLITMSAPADNLVMQWELPAGTVGDNLVRGCH